MVLLGPKGLSSEIVEEVHQTFRKAMEDPELIKGCETVDHVAIYKNPQDTANFLVHINEEIIGLVRDLKLPEK